VLARLPGGGESRGIWKIGPFCVKRWSQRVSSDDVRERCRVSRQIPVCNSMWYVPWFHWTLARWQNGEPATHDTCNTLLAEFPTIGDLHPGNVVNSARNAIVLDFAVSHRSPKRRGVAVG
jgi:hypothetical protein